MKKNFSFPAGIISLLIFLCIFLSACSKEKHNQKRKFKVTTQTFYRVSPTTPVPISVNGDNFLAFAYFPGGGEGEATHMGKVKTYFNQLAYGDSPEAPPVGSVSAPLTGISSLPVTGGPLPLIQAGDFSELTDLIGLFDVPENVLGNTINHILYNKNGDAIFTSAIAGSGSTFPISATVVGFNGKGIILGGHGKFKHAVGEFDYEGQFNLLNANDAKYSAEGWIGF